MSRYVALLRGINVGGRNPIRMADLKACFERHGFPDATTYIASGNVVFSTGRVAGATLVRRTEKMLAETFGYPASVVVRSAKQMRDVVEHAPKGFGGDPDTYRYDVLFLKEPLTSAGAIAKVPGREGVDEAHAGPGVIYCSRLVSRASQSLLGKIASDPIYQNLTIRNWRTTTQLLKMLEG